MPQSSKMKLDLHVTAGAAMRLDRVRPAEGPTDHELVLAYQRTADADERRRLAAELLGRYRRRVLIWCRRLIRDPEAAEDLAQDALLGALRSLDAYRDQGTFGAWLFMVTRNRCLSELRRRRVPLADAAVVELIADHGPGPDQDLERKRLGDDLTALLQEVLDQQEQDAIWLRCWEGLSVEVITQRLGITEVSGARGVLQRARRKLRRALEPS
jgi:RNA polymerase sigma-70 factor, ECF subfamily